LSFIETDNEIEKARRFIVRMWLSMGANMRTKNGMRFEIEKNTGAFKYFHAKLPEIITQVSLRLKHNDQGIVQIEYTNVFRLLKKYDRKNVLMYLDPPYLLETRKNRKHYKHEFTNEDHENLLKEITALKANVIISGYDNELYAKYLRRWRKETIVTKDQAGNKRQECIWMNYPVKQSEGLFI
jgi:DNA adenine methylase